MQTSPRSSAGPKDAEAAGQVDELQREEAKCLLAQLRVHVAAVRPQTRLEHARAEPVQVVDVLAR